MTAEPPNPAQAAGPAAAEPPIVRTSGSPRGRGRQYGAAARERVLLSLESYERLYAHFAGVDWRAATALAETFVPVIEEFNADHLEEMAGIADGAGVSFADVLALNLRTEILFSARARAAGAPPAECTAFADLRGPEPIVGQNWDWQPFAHRTIVILQTEPTNGPRWVSVVEAGLLAKFGMNSAGLTVLTNALVSSVDQGRPGVPYHLLLRALLESESPAAAEETLRSVNRSSSANYLIAAEGRAVDLEARPGGPAELARQSVAPGTVFVHTNHFTSPAGDFGTPAADRGPGVFPDTLARRTRATTLARAMPYPSVAAWQEVLRDHDNHPESICCHPDPAAAEPNRSSTVASTIVEPERQTMHLALGNPCTTARTTYAYRDFFKGRG
ncbi:C45 family autoproteolytic acyltransferase/hydolase [Streptomyces qinzhouensis]|uniref:Peptidase C45 n=1 Tax=Streptomyces qinzhouensis TaxID=2599401 RepID=A0A5B8IDN4_9ACTN|nr:C45 family peptidase [Streptomyces qinzhouensis]QDY76518.1 peptidase C45 [Streptomyces qinzhouensis]